MLDLKNVLVVVDPDQQDQTALTKVLSLAKHTDFNLTLLSCEYTQYLVEGYYFDAIDLPTLRQELLDNRKQTLERLAQPLRDAGLSVDTLCVWGHPAYEFVVREALKQKADLVVQHTRQHSALSRLLLSNNDWQLVRCCPVPLLLVKEKAWKASPTLLAAVDPMHSRHKPIGLDHKILRVTEALAEILAGDAHVVHSCNEIPLSGKYPGDASVEHGKAFDTLLSDFDIPTGNRHLTEEAPEFALSEIAHDLQADITVMGAISRSRLAGIFIGSTTEKVLDFLECDVLIVKPDNFQTPVKLTDAA